MALRLKYFFFNTTLYLPGLKLTAVVRGFTKPLSKTQCACCDQLVVPQEPVGSKWKAAELLDQLGKLVNTHGKSRSFLAVQICLIPLFHCSSQGL